MDTKFDVDKQNENSNNENENKMRYITLPFVGDCLKITKIKIKKWITKFCTPNAKVVFTTFKANSYFSTKDVMPKCFKSSVIYKYLFLLGVPCP